MRKLISNIFAIVGCIVGAILLSILLIIGIIGIIPVGILLFIAAVFEPDCNSSNYGEYIKQKGLSIVIGNKKEND